MLKYYKLKSAVIINWLSRVHDNKERGRERDRSGTAATKKPTEV